MHFPDVSHDVSQTSKNSLSFRCDEFPCVQRCGLRLTTVTLRWTSHSKPWTTRCSDTSDTPEKPGNSMIYGSRATTLGVSWGLRGFVQHVCKHHLRQAPHTMKGGECGGDSHEDQRRPVGAVHVPQHRVPPHRVGALRARLCGIRDAHRRRLSAGLHRTPSLNTSNLVVGR